MTDIATDLNRAAEFGFTLGEVQSAGLPVRYLRSAAGPGGPIPVVMVHGGGGLMGELDEAHGRLAERYEVIALEMPGWGPSANDSTTTLREMAGVLAGAVAGLGIERCRLIGTSIGGAVALWMTVDHPALVDCAVLESPAAFRRGAPEMSGPPDPSVFNLRPDKQRPRAPRPEVMELMMSMAPRGVDEPGLSDRLATLDVALLVVFGSEERMFPPADFADRYRTAPHSAVTIIENAAHDTKGDQPQAFVDVVAAFFDRGLDAVPARVAAPPLT